MPAFTLEDFHTPEIRPQTVAAPVDQAGLDSARSDGFEAGYKAGWDDAISSSSEDRNRIEAEFSRNLQALSFTFHEARGHVLHALEPVLMAMAEKVLPTLAQESLGQSVLEQLRELTALASDAPITILVSPANHDLMHELVGTGQTLPLTITTEDSVADGQVYMRTGQIERRIDLDDAIARMEQTVRAYFSLPVREQKYG